jgi:hypothetical protein
MSDSIGKITGETKPTGFVFTIYPGKEPAIFEYVEVPVVEREGEKETTRTVMAQVVGIGLRNPAISEDTPIEAIDTIVREGLNESRIVAAAKVIGYLDERNKPIYPRFAPQPGAEVKIASDDLLRDFVTVEDGGLKIGNILTRENVEADLNVAGLNRHLAILAATGAGKSHTAGVIMEELLDKGATIVAIDPHGDYTKMGIRRDGERNYKLADRIRVYQARQSGEGIQFTIKTSSLYYEELCSLAGIPRNASEQRRMVSQAINAIREREGEDYSYSVQEIIDELNNIASASGDAREIDRAEKVAFHLEKLARMQVFGTSEVPLPDILKPKNLTVLDLSGIPFEAQDIIAYHVLSRIFEARVRDRLGEKGESYKYPVFNIIEEAHRFCPNEKTTWSSRIITQIAAEGRKFGMFLTVITQRPSKIDQDVLSQCNSMIVQRIVNSADQNSIAKASESFAEDLLDDLPGLNIGEAVIVGPAVRVPLVVKIRDRKTSHGGRDIDLVQSLKDANEDAERERSEKVKDITGVAERIK